MNLKRYLEEYDVIWLNYIFNIFALSIMFLIVLFLVQKSVEM